LLAGTFWLPRRRIATTTRPNAAHRPMLIALAACGGSGNTGNDGGDDAPLADARPDTTSKRSTRTASARQRRCRPAVGRRLHVHDRHAQRTVRGYGAVIELGARCVLVRVRASENAWIRPNNGQLVFIDNQATDDSLYWVPTRSGREFRRTQPARERRHRRHPRVPPYQTFVFPDDGRSRTVLSRAGDPDDEIGISTSSARRAAAERLRSPDGRDGWKPLRPSRRKQ